VNEFRIELDTEGIYCTPSSGNDNKPVYVVFENDVFFGIFDSKEEAEKYIYDNLEDRLK